VLLDVLDLLRCPHCGEGLTATTGAVACGEGHSFDVARQGYVSLLTGDARLGSADSAPMVAAREAFLAAGHFEPFAEALARESERALAGGAPGCVVDLGAGTGWYIARVLDRLPGRQGLALDLSKHALRRAARAHPRIGAVACDAWRRLPVRDGVAALVLSVFAPRNGAELARLLGPGGALVVVTPTPAHLGQLVSALGLVTVDARKEERLEAELGPRFALERRTGLDWPLALTPADLANAVAMGPSARHVTPDERDAKIAALPQPFDVTASVTISVYRGLP
jgi:23S rRNA (guanine745-N1)-methyltransferase